MLPKMNGFDFCKQIRQDEKYREIPIIMLTARSEEVDRVIGFELGADDYIVKPFSPRELVLRIKAVMKRKGVKVEASKALLAEGPVKLDIPRHTVTVSGKEVKLTAMEFKLLSLLLQRCGRVQSREDLLQDVWDLGPDINTRTIDTHIKRLRQKLGDASSYIETIRGYGYRFKEDIESK
jgi:DNA-binding response OmpR family regulator